ncbi:hypothetical protein [Actinophytocola algeriensis]|jgi:hypothetical protein|uniref:Lipoprotein n=1 Tax=Actinophytocola algeriensis TaxID=1768010 RepID=A0A7W7QCA5_9PSEU|nr:hypothetical protein [Actinophytocola algeriensis]MBB4910944.1 hypothetical protein [Actinophytocola algeriensis]MBE1473937.1 hypothetical protein [Actinophytocola algeriensis]
MSLITVIAAAAVATAGCAGGTATGGGTDDGATGTPTQNGAISTGAARPPTELVRVTGKVEIGSQPGCLVLNAEFTAYVLVGGDPAALEAYEEDDTVVTVTGQAHAPAPQNCTDGVPLAIQKIEPAI